MRNAFLLLLSAVLTAGCSTPYDPVAAANIEAMCTRTNEVIAEGNAGKLPLKDSRQFLEQSKARTQILRTRTAPLRKNEEIMARIDSLESEYDKLLASNRPLRGKPATELRGKLFALAELRPVYYRATTSAVTTSSGSSTDSSTDSCTQETEDEKKKDDDCKKDKHDRGDRHDGKGKECRDDHEHRR